MVYNQSFLTIVSLIKTITESFNNQSKKIPRQCWDQVLGKVGMSKGLLDQRSSEFIKKMLEKSPSI